MNYKLALKLKKAGWPQEGDGGRVWKDDNHYAYVPTLSELIEACEDNFGFLSQVGKLVIQRQSAQEAVANFWLALNKK
jgi:hypothetical protein